MRSRLVFSVLRFQFDPEKNREVLRKHGVRLEGAQEIFDQAYLAGGKSGNPGQFRGIGWSGGRLCSVIHEIRQDSDGEFYRLITGWKAATTKVRLSITTLP